MPTDVPAAFVLSVVLLQVLFREVLFPERPDLRTPASTFVPPRQALNVKFAASLRRNPARRLARRHQIDLPDPGPIPNFADVSTLAVPPAIPVGQVTLDSMFAFMQEHLVKKSDLADLQQAIGNCTKRYIDQSLQGMTTELNMTMSIVDNL